MPSPSSTTLPATMKALQLAAYDGRLAVAEIARPTPQPGGVLVEMAVASVNPSDLMFIKGQYGVRKPLPTVPGFEGSGVVVQSGGGAEADALVGQRVSVASTADGTWAQYVAAPASMCFPLLATTTMEAGAMLVVNPLTAHALVELARDLGAAALVQTAAASALGRMVLARCNRLGLPVINVVRREPQVALLTSLGATEVLSTAEPDFDRRFAERARALKATVALEAVSGALTGRILRGMPRRSTVVLYGALSEEPCQLNPGDLIFAGKTLRGFWLSDLFTPQGLQQLQAGARTVQEHLTTDYASPVRGTYRLEDAVGALAEYQADMTAGKILLTPK